MPQINERIWLLELECLDQDDNNQTLYFSSSAYYGSDARLSLDFSIDEYLIGSTAEFYEQRLKQPCLYTNGAFTGAVIQTDSKNGFGEALLVNNDGGLDYLVDYALDGRRAALFLVYEDGSIRQIIEGTVESFLYQETQISIRLRDTQQILDLNHPSVSYLGTNDDTTIFYEGSTQDIIGVLKPQVFGNIQSAVPVLVNSQRLIYQVHHDVTGSNSCQISVVYDKGLALELFQDFATLDELLAATDFPSDIPPGKYATYAGYFALGSSPVGTITVDASNGYGVQSVGDVFNKVCQQAGFSVNTGDISILPSYTVGIYLTQDTKTKDMLDRLATSIGGYWYFDKNRIVRIKVLESPGSASGVPIDLNDSQITQISRTSSGAGSNRLPVWQVKIRCDYLQSVQSDFAGNVGQLERSRLSQEYREVVVENQDVKTRHPLSDTAVLETYLVNQSDASVVASNLLSLLSVRRDTVNVEARLSDETTDLLDISSLCLLRSYKFGYTNGRRFFVLGYLIDSKTNSCTINLWG